MRLEELSEFAEAAIELEGDLLRYGQDLCFREFQQQPWHALRFRSLDLQLWRRSKAAVDITGS